MILFYTEKNENAQNYSRKLSILGLGLTSCVDTCFQIESYMELSDYSFSISQVFSKACHLSVRPSVLLSFHLSSYLSYESSGMTCKEKP